MADKISQIQILLQQRVARARGQLSSASYNDTIDELSHDLANFSDQWNNRLVPLVTDLPDGTIDSNIDAFTDGLAGKTLYVDADATATTNASYYNSVQGRPNTVYEQMTSIYSELSSLREDIEEQIDDIVTTASQIAVADSASIYQAANIEDALAEVMTKVNTVVNTGLDLSAVAQHYLPATNNTYNLGSATKQVGYVYTNNLNAYGDVFMPAVYSDDLNGTTYRDLLIKDDGQLGYDSSTIRNKTNIVDLSTVDWVFSLRPVEFERKLENGTGNGKREEGLIAEEVAALNDHYIFRDDMGLPAGIHYKKLVVPLIKAVQNLQEQIKELQTKQ